MKMQFWDTLVIVFSLIYLCSCNESEANLALGRPTSASSAYGVFSSNAVVDGSDDLNWISGSCFATEGTDQSPWWMVDLGDYFRVSRVLVSNRADCIGQLCRDRLHDFGIEIFAGTTAAHLDVPSSLCAYHPGPVAVGATVTFSCDVIGRFVRLKRNITHNSLDLFTLCEVKVFGTQYTKTCSRYNSVLRHRMSGGISLDVDSMRLCARQCSSLPSCVGFNYKPNSHCEIVQTNELTIVPDNSWTYFYIKDFSWA